MMMHTSPKLSGLNRYAITPREPPTLIVATIVASSPTSAWRKFVTQHFGVLKPARNAYNISLDKETTP